MTSFNPSNIECFDPEDSWIVRCLSNYLVFSEREKELVSMDIFDALSLLDKKYSTLLFSELGEGKMTINDIKRGLVSVISKSFEDVIDEIIKTQFKEKEDGVMANLVPSEYPACESQDESIIQAREQGKDLWEKKKEEENNILNDIRNYDLTLSADHLKSAYAEYFAPQIFKQPTFHDVERPQPDTPLRKEMEELIISSTLKAKAKELGLWKYASEIIVFEGEEYQVLATFIYSMRITPDTDVETKITKFFNWFVKNKQTEIPPRDQGNFRLLAIECQKHKINSNPNH